MFDIDKLKHSIILTLPKQHIDYESFHYNNNFNYNILDTDYCYMNQYDAEVSYVLHPIVYLIFKNRYNKYNIFKQNNRYHLGLPFHIHYNGYNKDILLNSLNDILKTLKLYNKKINVSYYGNIYIPNDNISHLGITFMISSLIKNKDYVTNEYLLDNYNLFDSWSKIIINEIYNK